MNRDNFTRENIDLDNLQLDLQNPRIISGCHNEADCLKALLQNNRSEMLNLTKDIAKIGISIFPIMVIKEGDKWIVRDGNRRIAALKMLNDPDRCPILDLREKFKQIRKNMKIKIPQSIQCDVTDNIEAVSQYLDRLHKGKQQGVGLVSWNTYISSKNLIRSGQTDHHSKATKILMWAEELKIIPLVEETFPLTSFSRLVNFSEEPKLIEFNFDGNNPQPLRDLQTAKKIIFRVYSDLDNRTINSRNINTNADIKKYIESVLKSLSIEETTQQTAVVVPALEERQRIFASPATNKESWILKNDFRTLNLFMPADETKARDIAKELSYKTVLNIEMAPNAVAVLARTFIELSLNYYLLHNRIVLSDNLQGMDLKRRSDKVISSQKNSKLIDEASYEKYQNFFKDNGMFSFKTMHAYVHSKEYHPSPTDLRTIWKNIRILIINCWKD